MRFTFLGTSAGVPTRQRNVTALALAIDDSRDWYLVDCGEGTQQQLLHTRYSSARLRAIFITHVHGDHCYGLPGLIASANMSGRKDPLTICAPDGIEQFVRAVIEHTDLSRLRYPIHFLRSDAPDFRYSDARIEVSATALSHRVPCFSYRLEERPRVTVDPDKLTALQVPRGPLWGELQAGRSIALDDGRRIEPDDVRHPAWPARSVIVAGDNDQPELLIGDMARSDLMIHEATFTEDVLAQVGPQYMHSTAAMVAKAASTAGLRHLALTHFSQRYRASETAGEHCVDDLRREAAEHFNGALLMANDFACYELQRDKSLKHITD